MYILKIFNLISIVAISVYIGNYKSKMFGKRVIELKEFKNALSFFKSKIEFTYEPIREIFWEISHIIYKDQENIFKSFCLIIGDKDTGIAWNEAVENSQNHLVYDDKQIIAMLGKTLGKTDKTGQISEIEIVTGFLDKQIENSEDSKRKNEKLYKTLGGIIGLCIAIILI